MRCLRVTSVPAIICMPDEGDQTVTVNGKLVRFDFDERFGPLILRKNGRPATHQPGDRSPFWAAFQAWVDRRRGLAPQCTICDGTGSVVGLRLSRKHALVQCCDACGGAGRVPEPPAGGEGA